MRTCIIGGREFVIDPYKEPLVQLKGAVKGYMRGTLPYAVSDGKLPCAFCDPGGIRRRSSGQLRPSTFDNLSGHVQRFHNLTPQEYRDEVGLLRKTPLRSRRLCLASARNFGGQRGSVAALLQWHKDNAPGEAQRLGNRRRTENLSVSEHQNKRGICRDQFIAMAKEWGKKHNGRIGHEMLFAVHTTRKSLRRAGFADMGELAHLAGVKYVSKMSGVVSDKALLLILRQHAEELGRTPSAHDSGLAYGVPSSGTYVRRFGSWRQACVGAGLSPNAPYPRYEGDGVDILNAYAIVGTTTAAARIVHTANETVSSVLTKYGVEHTPGMSENQRREAKAWAATMARRLSGMPDEEGA